MPDVKVTSSAREAVLRGPPRAMRRIRSIRTRSTNGLGLKVHRIGLKVVQNRAESAQNRAESDAE